MLVVLRFQVAPAELAEFLDEARTAVDALAQRPGFLQAKVGRATDQADLLVIATQWRDVGSYRRALGSYEVKMRAVQLLSRAINEPTAFEILHSSDAEGVLDMPSALAVDADSVRLGEAAGPGR